MVAIVSNGPVAEVTSNSNPPARAALWTGRVLSGLVALFLTFDAVAKLLKVPQVIEGSAELGFPVSTLVTMGLALLGSLVVYLIPRTAPVGAILLTGYLGGAIATHVRVENPLFSHVLFPVYVAAFVWGGLYLRDQRVRGLLSAKS